MIAGLTAITAAALPLAALVSGCGSGGAGGPGPGGGGNPDVGAFTVTPDRAAPGTMVTLTGAIVQPDQAVTVRFGDVLTRVYGFTREGASDGIRVLVPPFIDSTGEAVTPAGPVTVTVQIEGRQPRVASNAFTVMPLPPAPGASAAIAAEMTAFAAFLGDFSENVVRQFHFSYLGFLPEYPGPAEFKPAVAAIQYGRALQYLMDGAGQNNPYSLTAVMTRQSPVTSGLPISQDILDALIAQGPAAQMLQTLSRGILGALNQLAPGSVTPRGGRHASLPALHPSRQSAIEMGGFDRSQVDWNKVRQLGAAKNIIATIQFTKLLAGVGTAAAPFEMFTAALMPALQGAVLATGPLAPALEAGLAVIDLGLFIEGVTSKILGVWANLLPSRIDDFFVDVNGTNRRTGDPPVDIPLQYVTPVSMYLVPGASGGPTFSIYGIAGIMADTAARTFPPLRDFFKQAGQADYIKSLSLSLVGIMDGVWAKIEGAPPPDEWSQYKSNADNSTIQEIKPFKYQPIEINNTALVTVQSFSTNLLGIVVENDASMFKGASVGSHAGYKAYLRRESMNPGLPSLADVAAEKWFVAGTVNIVAGAVHGTVQ